MTNFFIGADPLNEARLKAAFGTNVRTLWAGGWVYTTTEKLDQVSKTLVALELTSSVVFPFDAGHQIVGADHSGHILNQVIEASQRP